MARGIEAYQAYATADVGAIAFETEARDGLVVDEGALVEIVQPGMSTPVGPGEVGEKELGDHAWYLNNARYRSHPVGLKKPSPLGLYDMTGNVGQWVSDWYVEDFYGKSPRDNPQGPATGRMRVLRGGFWGDTASFARVTRRISLAPDVKGPGYGFRLATSAE